MYGHLPVLVKLGHNRNFALNPACVRTCISYLGGHNLITVQVFILTSRSANASKLFKEIVSLNTEAHCVSTSKTSGLILCAEIITTDPEKHTHT